MCSHNISDLRNVWFVVFPPLQCLFLVYIYVAGKVYVIYLEDGVKRWLLEHQIKLGLDATSKPESLPESGLFPAEGQPGNIQGEVEPESLPESGLFPNEGQSVFFTEILLQAWISSTAHG